MSIFALKFPHKSTILPPIKTLSQNAPFCGQTTCQPVKVDAQVAIWPTSLSRMKNLNIMPSPFETGRIAGQQLKKLFADLNDSEPLTPAPLETISSMLKEIWSWSSAYNLPDEVLGIFSEILPKANHSTSIIEIWGTDQFLHQQKDCAPMCNIPANSGLFAFAHWTGESDGDAWCYDIKYNCIRCIPVGEGDADPDKARIASYGVFPHFDHFVAFLRCEAERRHFLQSR